jgi:hypothetical protein
MSSYEIANNENTYWHQELKKPSLKEPPLKYKYYWLKPLSTFHRMEFRGE